MKPANPGDAGARQRVADWLSRFLESNIGFENPTASCNAIHDHTEQERGFEESPAGRAELRHSRTLDRAMKGTFRAAARMKISAGKP
jgi:hypothetical protein